MTTIPNTDSTQENPTTADWGVDDEIDLRQYIQVLINWSREILIIAILAAILAALAILAIRSLDTPIYQSSATIVIARVKSDIIFDERYRTQSDTGITTLQASANSRRAALLGLVSSGSIAQAVINELGSVLEETEQEPGTLLGAVDAEILRRVDNRTESDLIAIHVTSDDPEKATAIANAWAKHYVEQVNTLYGQVPPEVFESVQIEMESARIDYQSTQDELERFVADNEVKKLERLIAEKQGIIDSLQLGKQTAIDALVEEETNAQRQVISAYLNALAQNRLLAFNKEQQAKRELVSSYIDADMENRLLAIQKDREARVALFDVFATTQISSTLAVLTQQVDGDLFALESLHAQRNRLYQLQASAQSLQEQIADGGDSAIQTSMLALTLLKTQAFAVIDSENVPTIQLTVDAVRNSSLSAVELAADVSALIEALNTQLESVQQQIASVAGRISSGDYQLIDQLSASRLAVSAPLSQTTAALASGQEINLSTLSEAITQGYTELFDLGGLATMSSELTADSPIMAEILQIYPELFTLGELSQAVAQIGSENPLTNASEMQAQALLQLQGLGDVSSYTDAASGINEAIEQLEIETQSLEARLESESARELQLTQRRDLGWETFVTLSNKVTELRLERNATDSEVRLAVPAISPTDPLPGVGLMRNVALAGAAGLMLGVFVAFLASFMGQEPFLSRRRTSVAPTQAAG